MASANVSFDQIPASIRKPGKYFEFNTRLAVRTLPGNAQRVLILAQGLPAGSALGVPTQVYDDQSAAALFGAGSQAHRMAAAAIRANPYLDLTVLAVPDPDSAIAAAGTVTFSGVASAQGVLALDVAGERLSVAVASGCEASAAAAQLAQAVAEHGSLPLAATAEDGVLSLTARNKGEEGNALSFACVCSVPGLSAQCAPMSGGGGVPDLAAALESVFAADFSVYCLAWSGTAALNQTREHLDALGHPLEQRGAVGVFGFTGTLERAVALAPTVNSARMLCAFLPGTLTTASETAAAMAAVLAGEEDPARPLNTLQLTGVAAPALTARLSRVQQETALKNGLTPLEAQADGTVRVVRAVSTYVRNAEGAADVSLLDITTIRTLDYVRKAVRERIMLRFPREKLSTRTPPKVRSELLDVLRKLEELEIVEEVSANADGVLVERDLQDANRLNARIPADVVNGLHIFAGRIDLLL